ncbi:MAG: hypothetical protein R3B70_12170 [Polyangiaceae bacterium]
MPLHRSSVALSIALSALACPCGSALAEPPAPEKDSADKEVAVAREAHVRGLDARERGDWGAAYSAFLEAWVHKRHWEIAVNLGEAEMRIGRYEAAVEHLSLALNDPGFARRSKTLVDSERQQISEWIAQATSRMKRPEAARSAPALASSGADKAEPPLQRPWAWVAGGGAGLSLANAVAGGVMSAMAQDKVNEVKVLSTTLPGRPGEPASVRCAGDAAATCVANEERLRTADSLRSAGVGLLVTAGAVMVASAVIAVVGWKRGKPAAVVVPTAGPGAAGVVVSASW